MKKVRKDGKGMLLRKGETYLRKRKIYCFSYTDAIGKRKFLYANSLIELREKEEEFQRNKLDKLDTYVMTKADINFVFDRYISTRTELRSNTKTHYCMSYNKYVRNGFGKKKIIDVRYSDVICFYQALIERGLSIGSVSHLNNVLHGTFKMALRDNVIRSNPTIGAVGDVRKKLDLSEGVRHSLSIEEQKEFLSFLERPEYKRWKPLFVVLFGTGCRIGEVIGLRWCDVDMEKGIISINHSINYGPRVDNGYKSDYEVTLPKTAAGIRTIPMLGKVKEAFLLEKQNQKEGGYHPIVEIGGMKDFIFCNRFGNIHHAQAINREIHRIVENHNAYEEIAAKKEGREPVFIPGFSCHVARHTFCSRLCENETNVKVIQTVMGHKNIQTTLNIYAEVCEQKKKEIFESLNNDNVIF